MPPLVWLLLVLGVLAAIAEVFSAVGRFLSHPVSLGLIFIAGLGLIAISARTITRRARQRQHASATPGVGGSWSQLGGNFMDILDRLSDGASIRAALSQSVRRHRPPVDASKLAGLLKGRIFGQNAAIDALAATISARSRKTKRDKPLAVTLLVGPPGTGKTEAGKALAEAMGYGPTGFILIEGAQAQNEAALSRYFGSEQGYAGGPGELTTALATRADQVVLLDEFEKADLKFQRAFLSAWNDGFAQDRRNPGRIPVTDAVFIITSNAEQRRLVALYEERFAIAEHDSAEAAYLKRAEFTKAAKALLRENNAFPPEILDRLDGVFCFLPVRGEDLARLVVLGLEKQGRDMGLKLTAVEPDVITSLVIAAETEGLSARDVGRRLESELAASLAEAQDGGFRQVKIIIDEATGRTVAEGVS